MHAALAYLTTNTGTPFHGFASLPLTLLISAVLASQFGTSVGAKTLTLKQAVLVSGVQGNHAWQLVIALPCFLVVLSLYFCPPCPQICVGRWPTIPCLSEIFPSFAIHLLPAACAPTLFPRPLSFVLTAGLLLSPKTSPLTPLAPLTCVVRLPLFLSLSAPWCSDEYQQQQSPVALQVGLVADACCWLLCTCCGFGFIH